MNGEVREESGRREGEVGREKAERVSSLLPRSSRMSALVDLPFSTAFFSLDLESLSFESLSLMLDGLLGAHLGVSAGATLVCCAAALLPLSCTSLPCCCGSFFFFSSPDLLNIPVNTCIRLRLLSRSFDFFPDFFSCVFSEAGVSSTCLLDGTVVDMTAAGADVIDMDF